MENDSNIVTETGATHSDAPVTNVDNRTEDQMLGDLLRTSDFTRDLFDDEALTEEHAGVPATEDTTDDDDLEVSEVIEEEEVEEAIEEEEADEDDTSTQEAVYGLDDLDDFKVKVKIDGEESAVSIEELVKSYQTDQHLSNKGRELGDARKALDEERQSKIDEIDNIMGAASQILQKSENAHAKEFHSLEEQIKEARENDDTYLVSELKDKKDQAQEKYWAAKNEKDMLIAQAEQQKQTLQQENWNKQLEHFSNEISKAIPDWNEEIGMANREFALSKGIPEEFLSNMVDVNVIKFVDDYRRSEQAKSKGSVKRSKAPVKATPVKKSPSIDQRKVKEQKVIREKVLSGQGSSTDNDDFLRNLAARHFE